MFSVYLSFFFFFNDTATTEIYTLSLHDALPISTASQQSATLARLHTPPGLARTRSEEHTSELQSHSDLVCRLLLEKKKTRGGRRRDLALQHIAWRVLDRLADQPEVGREPAHFRLPGKLDQAVGIVLFLLMIRRPPKFTLFPYTTLFR